MMKPNASWKMLSKSETNCYLDEPNSAETSVLFCEDREAADYLLSQRHIRSSNY